MVLWYICAWRHHWSFLLYFVWGAHHYILCCCLGVATYVHIRFVLIPMPAAYGYSYEEAEGCLLRVCSNHQELSARQTQGVLLGKTGDPGYFKLRSCELTVTYQYRADWVHLRQHAHTRAFVYLLDTKVTNHSHAVIVIIVTHDQSISFLCNDDVGHRGFHGVMVSTQDSESCDPSSSLGGT